MSCLIERFETDVVYGVGPMSALRLSEGHSVVPSDSITWIPVKDSFHTPVVELHLKVPPAAPSTSGPTCDHVVILCLADPACRDR